MYAVQGLSSTVLKAIDRQLAFGYLSHANALWRGALNLARRAISLWLDLGDPLLAKHTPHPLFHLVTRATPGNPAGLRLF